MENEAAWRLGFFLGAFACVALWEALSPARARKFPRMWRWPNNLALVAVDSILVRLLVPGIGFAAALWAQASGIGLFNAIEAPFWLVFAICLVAFDLALWAQHVTLHKVPFLWRLHRVHHADPDFDATTGLRFHPGEILISAIYKAAVAAALGAPPEAILAFDIMINACSMLTHANAGFPPALDRALRLAFVTPDMHRIHHSPERQETDSNYGFHLTFWDRLFGTYRASSARGEIGLERFDARADQRVDKLLVQPLAD